ncbi:MAG: hypothetical protein HRT94_01430 [Alphaproteobacteria bacterium]|nr:hypothetical protein [Alphaproteobacteria bacterium]
MNKNTQNGSVFFYILLAIGLIAALSYVVAQNNRPSTSMLTGEQARIATNEIIEYGNTFATAVQKLKLRGCSDTEISFENNIETGYTNGTNTTCQVFHIDGGNINYTVPSSNWGNASEWRFTGRHPVNFVNSFDADLIVILSDISKNICLELNQRVSVNNVGDDAPEDTGIPANKFVGAYANSTPLSNEASQLQAKPEACYKDSDDNIYVYYKVLITR